MNNETEQFARIDARRIAEQFFPGRKKKPEGFEEVVAVALTNAYRMGVECAAVDLKATHQLVNDAVARLQGTFRHLLDVKDLGADGLASIIELYNSGSRIDAIKLYRNRLGVGLKEAKEAVEHLVMQSPPRRVGR